MKTIGAVFLALFWIGTAQAQVITGSNGIAGPTGATGPVGLPTGLGYASPCFTIGSDVANQSVVCGSSTTNPVTYSATGSDADVVLKLAAKITTGAGYVQLGPQTVALGIVPPNSQTTVDITQTSAIAPFIYGLTIYTKAPDIVVPFSGSATGISSTVDTPTAGTHDLGTQIGIFSLGQSSLPAGRKTDTVYGGLIQGYVTNGGNTDELLGTYAQILTDSGSIATVGKVFSGWLYDLDNSTGVSKGYIFWGNFALTGPLLEAYGLWLSDAAGKAPNTYYEWFDSRGVFRIRDDNTFDSTTQAIPALYNPQFTKYTPGAVNFERVILSQWNGNVAEIGTQKGGTGTLRNLRLIGPALLVDSLKTTGAATGKKVVCVDTATGQLYASSTGTDCSN